MLGSSLGYAGFSDLDNIDGTAIIGYRLSEQGYGSRELTTSAVNATLASVQFEFSFVYALIPEDNLPLWRVLARRVVTTSGSAHR